MNRHKQVGLVAVGNVGPFVQGHEDVCLACVYHPDVGAVALHIAPEGQRHVKVDVLFFRELAPRPGVVASMAGINDQRETLVCRYNHSGKQH